MVATVAVIVPFAALIGPLVWMEKSTGSGTAYAGLPLPSALFNS